MDVTQVSAPEAECQSEAIHLFVEQKGGTASPVVALRWCICPSVFERLKWGAPNPHVLLVVTQGGEEVDRKIVPLEQEMEYLYFRTSGEHKILATVLCCDDPGLLVWHFSSGRNGFFKYDPLDCHGRIRNDFHSDAGLEGRHIFQAGLGEADVVVAQEFFAKKPPAWLGLWANLWFETKPRDQCQLRRRCMLAFSVQPPVVFVWVLALFLFRFLAASFLRFGCGVRGVKFLPAIHPFRDDNNDVWWNADGSVFLTRSDGKMRHWFFALFTPVGLVSLFGVMFIPLYFMGCVADILLAVGLTIGCIAVVIALHFIFLLAYMAIREMVGLIWKQKRFSQDEQERIRDAESRERVRKERERQRLLFEQTYSPLVCQGVPLRASLDALPKRRRTLYLRFMNLKEKLCKPFPKW